MESYKIDSGIARQPVDVPNLSPEFHIVEAKRKTYENLEEHRFDTRLRDSPLVVAGGLSVGLFNKLRPFLKQATLFKDEYLYQQDGQIESIFFPETAVISEFQTLADGRTIEVAVTGGEGAVGISSVWSSSHAVNCAQVCVAGSAYKIESKILEKEIDISRPLQTWLHNQINSYIKQISQKVICNTHHAVEERFCTWLLMLQDRSKRNKFNLTQEYIAGVLGVYRPSVTCMAKSLRQKNAIDYIRGQIFITDRQKLKKMSCSCYSELVPNL